MWYVIQTTSGKEENIKIQCETYLPAGLVEKYVIPLYEERRRFHGEWHTLQKKLFPGYVFFISDQAEELFLQLKKVPAMTKMLGTGDEIVALTSQEIEFILRFCGEDDIAEISEGVIENDQVHILSGPLIGLEGAIRKIDRHKRKAWLEMEMFGRKQQIEVGLEIIKKIENK